MLPLRTIRDPRAATRAARSARASELLGRLEATPMADGAVRWGGWEAMHGRMADAVRSGALPRFQADPAIAPQICGGGGEIYLTRLEESVGAELAGFFLSTYRETLCGDPRDLVTVKGTPITRTAMRHLYHLAVLHGFCRRYYGVPIDIVEIGGGFGNLARLAVQYSLARRYTIVDFPASLAVQYFYLTEFLDEADVAVWTGEAYLAGSAASSVRLALPQAASGGIPGAAKERPLLLASTMALTEIPEPGQSYYLERIPADAYYVFGQTHMTALPQGVATDGFDTVLNLALFQRLAERTHPVLWRRGDYYSELLSVAL